MNVEFEVRILSETRRATGGKRGGEAPDMEAVGHR
jgi:hypothetical protein